MKRFTLIAILCAALCAAVSVAAEAQIRFTRQVNLSVEFADGEILLTDSRQLWPEAANVQAWMVVAVDKPLPDNEKANMLRQAMDAVAARLSRAYRTPADIFSADPNADPSLRDLTNPHNVTVNLTARFDDSAGISDRLASNGFESLDSRSADIEDVTYTMTRWVKADKSELGPFGTANAEIRLTPDYQIDPSTGEFAGRFSVAQSSRVSVADIPDNPGAREHAEQLRGAYQQELNDEVKAVLDALNQPRPLLSDEDRLRFGDGAAGAVLEFPKALTYEWRGEEKSVALTVRATLGGMTIAGVTP